MRRTGGLCSCHKAAIKKPALLPEKPGTRFALAFKRSGIESQPIAALRWPALLFQICKKTGKSAGSFDFRKNKTEAIWGCKHIKKPPGNRTAFSKPVLYSVFLTGGRIRLSRTSMWLSGGDFLGDRQWRQKQFHPKSFSRCRVSISSMWVYAQNFILSYFLNGAEFWR